jgi:hypothetical protein
LNLYKKFLAKSHEVEELGQKYESERNENRKLKELNRLLLEGEYKSQCFEDLTPIC